MSMQVSTLVLQGGTPEVQPPHLFVCTWEKKCFSATVAGVELEGKGFIKDGKQEIWRGWRELCSTQGEMTH